MEVERKLGMEFNNVEMDLFHMPIYGIPYSNRLPLDKVNLFIFICIQILVSKAVSWVGDQLVPAVTMTSSSI